MYNRSSSKVDSGLKNEDGSIRYNKVVARSGSVVNKDGNRTLKFAGKNTLGIPVRERFNEKPDEVIEEQRSQFGQGLNSLSKRGLGTMQDGDARSGVSRFSKVSRASKKSLTTTELRKFFEANKQDVDGDMKSRFSKLSTGQVSKLKSKLR